MSEVPALLFEPNVRIYGMIDDGAVVDVLGQLGAARKSGGPIVVELTTLGGDADGARRIALEIRLCRTRHGLETYFVGKTAVMSAGATVMAAFPRERRFLTDDTTLLIHERRITRTLELDGPMRAEIQIVRELLSELESAERVERRAFAELAEGSSLSAEELYERATKNLYLSAEEARDLRLIEAVI